MVEEAVFLRKKVTGVRNGNVILAFSGAALAVVEDGVSY
jgi:hypothetical protein